MFFDSNEIDTESFNREKMIKVLGDVYKNLATIQDVVEEMLGAGIKLISKGFSRDCLKEVILKNYGNIL